MTLYINREPKDLPGVMTVEDVLLQLPLQTLEGIAVAINEQVVSRRHWKAQPVHENDSILIIQATRGG